MSGDQGGEMGKDDGGEKTPVQETTHEAESETNQTKGSEMVQADVSEASQAEVPETAQADVSETILPEVPETSLSDLDGFGFQGQHLRSDTALFDPRYGATQEDAPQKEAPKPMNLSQRRQRRRQHGSTGQGSPRQRGPKVPESLSLGETSGTDAYESEVPSPSSYTPGGFKNLDTLSDEAYAALFEENHGLKKERDVQDMKIARLETEILRLSQAPIRSPVDRSRLQVHSPRLLGPLPFSNTSTSAASPNPSIISTTSTTFDTNMEPNMDEPDTPPTVERTPWHPKELLEVKRLCENLKSQVAKKEAHLLEARTINNRLRRKVEEGVAEANRNAKTVKSLEAKIQSQAMRISMLLAGRDQGQGPQTSPKTGQPIKPDSPGMIDSPDAPATPEIKKKGKASKASSLKNSPEPSPELRQDLEHLHHALSANVVLKAQLDQEKAKNKEAEEAIKVLSEKLRREKGNSDDLQCALDIAVDKFCKMHLAVSGLSIDDQLDDEAKLMAAILADEPGDGDNRTWRPCPTADEYDADLDDVFGHTKPTKKEQLASGRPDSPRGRPDSPRRTDSPRRPDSSRHPDVPVRPDIPKAVVAPSEAPYKNAAQLGEIVRTLKLAEEIGKREAQTSHYTRKRLQEIDFFVKMYKNLELDIPTVTEEVDKEISAFKDLVMERKELKKDKRLAERIYKILDDKTDAAIEAVKLLLPEDDAESPKRQPLKDFFDFLKTTRQENLVVFHSETPEYDPDTSGDKIQAHRDLFYKQLEDWFREITKKITNLDRNKNKIGKTAEGKLCDLRQRQDWLKKIMDDIRGTPSLASSVAESLHRSLDKTTVKLNKANNAAEKALEKDKAELVAAINKAERLKSELDELRAKEAAKLGRGEASDTEPKKLSKNQKKKASKASKAVAAKEEELKLHVGPVAEQIKRLQAMIKQRNAEIEREMQEVKKKTELYEEEDCESARAASPRPTFVWSEVEDDEDEEEDYPDKDPVTKFPPDLEPTQTPQGQEGVAAEPENEPQITAFPPRVPSPVPRRDHKLSEAEKAAAAADAAERYQPRRALLKMQNGRLTRLVLHLRNRFSWLQREQGSLETFQQFAGEQADRLDQFFHEDCQFRGIWWDFAEGQELNDVYEQREEYLSYWNSMSLTCKRYREQAEELDTRIKNTLALENKSLDDLNLEKKELEATMEETAHALALERSSVETLDREAKALEAKMEETAHALGLERSSMESLDREAKALEAKLEDSAQALARGEISAETLDLEKKELEAKKERLAQAPARRKTQQQTQDLEKKEKQRIAEDSAKAVDREKKVAETLDNEKKKLRSIIEVKMKKIAAATETMGYFRAADVEAAAAEAAAAAGHGTDYETLAETDRILNELENVFPRLYDAEEHRSKLQLERLKAQVPTGDMAAPHPNGPIPTAEEWQEIQEAGEEVRRLQLLLKETRRQLTQCKPGSATASLFNYMAVEEKRMLEASERRGNERQEVLEEINTSLRDQLRRAAEAKPVAKTPKPRAPPSDFKFGIREPTNPFVPWKGLSASTSRNKPSPPTSSPFNFHSSPFNFRSSPLNNNPSPLNYHSPTVEDDTGSPSFHLSPSAPIPDTPSPNPDTKSSSSGAGNDDCPGKLKKKEKEVTELKDQINDLQSQLNKVTAQLNAAKDKCDGAASEAIRLTKVATKKTIDGLTGQRNELESKVKELQSRLEEEMQRASELESKLRQRVEENDYGETDSNREKMRTDVQDLVDETDDDEEADIDKMKADSEAWLAKTRVNEETSIDVDEMQAELQSLKDEHALCDKKHATLTAEVEGLKRGQDLECPKKLKKVNAEKDELAQKVKDLEREQSRAKTSHEADIAALRKKHAAIQVQLEAAKEHSAGANGTANDSRPSNELTEAQVNGLKAAAGSKHQSWLTDLMKRGILSDPVAAAKLLFQERQNLQTAFADYDKNLAASNKETADALAQATHAEAKLNDAEAKVERLQKVFAALDDTKLGEGEEDPEVTVKRIVQALAKSFAMGTKVIDAQIDSALTWNDKAMGRTRDHWMEILNNDAERLASLDAKVDTEMKVLRDAEEVTNVAIEGLNTSNDELTAMVKAAEAAKATADRRVNAVEKEIRALKEQLKAKVAEEQKASKDLKEAKESRDTAEGRCKELEGRLKEAEKAKDSQGVSEWLEKRLNEAMKDAEAAKVSLGVAEYRVKEAEKATEKLEKAKQQLEERLQELEAERDAAAAPSDETIADLERLRFEQSSRADEYDKDRIGELELDNSRFVQEIEELKKDVARRETKYLELEGKKALQEENLRHIWAFLQDVKERLESSGTWTPGTWMKDRTSDGRELVDVLNSVADELTTVLEERSRMRVELDLAREELKKVKMEIEHWIPMAVPVQDEEEEDEDTPTTPRAAQNPRLGSFQTNLSPLMEMPESSEMGTPSTPREWVSSMMGAAASMMAAAIPTVLVNGEYPPTPGTGRSSTKPPRRRATSPDHGGAASVPHDNRRYASSPARPGDDVFDPEIYDDHLPNGHQYDLPGSQDDTESTVIINSPSPPSSPFIPSPDLPRGQRQSIIDEARSPDLRLNPPPRPPAPGPGFSSSPYGSDDSSSDSGGSPLPRRRPGALRDNRPLNLKPKTTTDKTPVPANALEAFVGMLWLYWETFVLCLVSTCWTSYWIFGHTLFPFMIGANGLLTWFLHVSGHRIASPRLQPRSFLRPAKNQMITAVTIMLLAYYVYYNYVLYTALWTHLDNLAHENGFERAYFHEMVKKNLRRLNSAPGIDERLFEGWWFTKMEYWAVLAVGGWKWFLAWFMWVVMKAKGGIVGTWEATMEQIEAWRLAFIQVAADFFQARLPAAAE